MSKKGVSDRDMEFLFEMGSIRYIERMWKRFQGTDFANLAEHHFRVYWIAMMIAQTEKDVDTDKIAKFALMHDIAESRTGDVDYLARQYVKRDETLGIKDMAEGTMLEKELLELWKEYESKESIEAKIVKDADNLDVDFELEEQRAKGDNLRAQWKQKFRVKRDKYYTQAARDIFDKLVDANPADWHINGRNRLNAGDWKK